MAGPGPVPLTGRSEGLRFDIAIGFRPLPCVPDAAQHCHLDEIGRGHVSGNSIADAVTSVWHPTGPVQRRRVVSRCIYDSFSGLRTAYSPVTRPPAVRTAMTVSSSPLSRMISAG